MHRAGELAATLRFSLDELRYEYPSEITGGETASGRLARLAQEGLDWRYPAGAPDKAQKQMAHELDLIGKLKYEPYFLTVHDIVAFRPVARHPVPGPRLGGQFDRVLCAWGSLRFRPRSARWSLSALSPRRATSRPTSTWISSMSGARR